MYPRHPNPRGRLFCRRPNCGKYYALLPRQTIFKKQNIKNYNMTTCSMGTWGYNVELQIQENNGSKQASIFRRTLKFTSL